MRRSFEEPNSLRATAPIITLTLGISAYPVGLAATRFFRKSVPAAWTVPSCLAGGAKRNRRKIRRYSGGDEAIKHPDTGRQIGGGRFFVNATAIFTRSLGAARFLPLPSPGRLSECPRRSRAGAWPPDRGMAGQSLVFRRAVA